MFCDFCTAWSNGGERVTGTPVLGIFVMIPAVLLARQDPNHPSRGEDHDPALKSYIIIVLLLDLELTAQYYSYTFYPRVPYMAYTALRANPIP